jgi:hypothetical protein
MAANVIRARLSHHIGPFYFSLLGLANVPESGWDGYVIAGPRFDQRRNALSQGAIRGVIDDKILFYGHCVRAGLPTIPIICRVGAGQQGRDGSIERVKDTACFEELMRSAPSVLFVKPTNGAHGRGISRVVKQGDGIEVEGEQRSFAEFFSHLQHQCQDGTGLIVQPQVRPHPEMLPFASANGLPTVRVITAMMGDEPKVLFACLRMPVGASVTDNFGDGTNGNLVAGVEVRSGVLTAARASSHRNWPVMVQVDAHPDSGHKITGVRLPSWDDIKEAALHGQRSLPMVKTIGWDVAVTPDGVVLVELNSNYGVYSLQVAYQRGLKAELAEALNITID